MMSLALSLIVAGLAGIFVGICSGLFGVGGGVIVIPLLRLVFGMNPLISTSTSLFTITLTSASGIVSHMRNKTCVLKLGIALGLGGACTSPLGALLAQRSPDWLIMLAVSLVIAYSAISVFHKALTMQPTTPKRKTAVEEIPSYLNLSKKKLVLAFCIGLGTGALAGYVGVGGGFIMVPLMLSGMRIPMKLASGTSLIAVFLLAIPGAVTQGFFGHVDYLIGIAIACGSIPGAFLGAKLIKYVPEKTLRLGFGVLLIVMAVLLVVKEIGF